MKDCVLITGGAGFIGSAISEPMLSESRMPVVAIDCLHPQVHARRERPDQLHRDVKLIVGDICDENVWKSFLQNWRPQIVVHLAAETGTGQSLSEASRHTHVNVTGTARMLDSFAASGHVPKRFILTSSRAVYGEGLWTTANGGIVSPGQRSKVMLDAGQWDFPGLMPLPFTADTTPPRPTSIYGATKLAQEHILQAWTSSYASELTILRLQNVYGPGQSLTNPYTGIVSLFSRIARAQKRIPLYEDGQMRRDFVFINDVAQAILTAISSEEAPGRIFDIGSGVATTIEQVAEHIARYYSAPSPYVCGKFRNGDVRHASCEIEAASTIGWRPGTTLESGLSALCAWIDSNVEVDDAH